MIKKVFLRTKKSVRDFTFDPISNLGYLIPVLIVVIAFVSGVVAYVKFIVDGGYVSQINATKEFGLFGGYDDKFTLGTTEMITAGVIGKIILILVCVEFALMLINYFRNSGKAKRIIMIVDLPIVGILIALKTTEFWAYIDNRAAVEVAAYETLQLFGGITVDLKAIVITHAVLTLVSIIALMILLLITKDCRCMIGYSAIALALAYIGIPLLFLFLQNVIPLATGVIALAIIGVIIFIIFKVLLDGNTSSSNSSYSSNSHQNANYNSKKDNTGNLSEKGEQKRLNKEFVNKESCAYISDFNRTLGIKLWKVHGITHDYIASDNGLVTREICSLEDFEKGKFRIYESESGKEIKSSQIQWMKQN